MTPDERILLSNFLRDLAQARAAGKDAEAEGMIKEAFSANPDAAYLIVQHAILSDQALQAAQARLAQFEGGQGSSFLGGARPQTTAVPPSQPYAPQPYAPQPAYGPQPTSPFSSGGGLGSFLRTAGTMAAGVAAGDLLFEGVSGLFGGHRGFGFGGGWGGGGFGGGPTVENVTINEYNDDGFRDDDGGFDDDGDGWDDNS